MKAVSQNEVKQSLLTVDNQEHKNRGTLGNLSVKLSVLGRAENLPVVLLVTSRCSVLLVLPRTVVDKLVKAGLKCCPKRSQRL